MKFLTACIFILLIGATFCTPIVPEDDTKKTEKRGIYGFGYGGYGGFGHGYGGYGGFGYPSVGYGHYHGPSFYGHHGYGGFPHHGFGGYGYHHFH